MQEQLNRETIAISLKASNLTANTAKKAFMMVLLQMQNRIAKTQTPKGKQSVKQLMNHNVATNTVEITGDTGLFDKVAKKWAVDYAFYQTGEDKYLLLFKSGQTDAITAAFSEYTAKVMQRESDMKRPFKEQFREAEQNVKRERAKHKERTREREHEYEAAL
ncbi:MAG: PcfB family protein [Dehalococcoidia bacterium]|nr:PcfB family protein [Dehalococcoidia bacterium]